MAIISIWNIGAFETQLQNIDNQNSKDFSDFDQEFEPFQILG